MSHEGLAEYNCQYLTDGPEPMLELFHRGQSCISINPDSDHGQRQFEDFIASSFGKHLRGRPRLMQMKDKAYSDQSTPLISIASNASLDILCRCYWHSAKQLPLSHKYHHRCR